MRHLTAPRALNALILACGLILLPHCAGLETVAGELRRPEFKLDRLEFAGISPQSLRLRLHTRLINHYPIPAPSGSVDAGLRLEASEFTRIRASFAQGIPARGSAPMVFDVELPFAGLVNVYNQAGASESLSLGIAGNVNVKLPSLQNRPPTLSMLPESLAIPFQFQERIPALRPEIDLRNFRLTPPSLSLNPTISAQFDLAVLNRSGAALNVQSLNYDLALENTPFMTGAAQDIRNEGRESVATVRTELPLVQLGVAIINASRRGTAQFRLKGGGALDTPNFPLPELLRMEFDKSGQTRW